MDPATDLPIFKSYPDITRKGFLPVTGGVGKGKSVNSQVEIGV